MKQNGKMMNAGDGMGTPSAPADCKKSAVSASFEARSGVYPTMITPYKNGSVDTDAVRNLVKWYWQQGCDGIFADCQSSEIHCLSLQERVNIIRAVMETVHELASRSPDRARMMVVASGHVSDSFAEQVRELNAIAAEKPDALILISNRMDIENTSDGQWIADTERLIAELPPEMPLGVYECPNPYKRLLSETMLRWCVESGRFYFAKDTCCDADMIAKRLEICKGSHLKLLNANAQTLLRSIKDGAHGYCGVMANFHPDLYVRLLKGDLMSQGASLLQDFISLASTMAEAMTYPCCAKYYLDRFEGVHMEWSSRSADACSFTAYQQDCIDQLAELTAAVRKA